MTEPSHILVIEDDADTRANLGDILELDGYRVHMADSVRAALARTDWSDISVIISDRRLPDGNVDSHLPKLRALAPDASLVIVTGYRDLEGAIACLRAGADDYVLKPVNPDDLRASLRRFIELRTAKRALRDAEAVRLRLEREVLDASTMEQQRIGRDLHDGLGQELTGIAFLARVLNQKLQQKRLPEASDATEIVNLVNQTIDHARALVRGLCPVDLESDGLGRALEQLAEDVQTSHGLTCRFKGDSAVAVSDVNIASQVYYIAREAVHNAVKHAKATRIDVRLRAAGGRAELSVRDDGIGISNAAGTGRGLQIMPYRARVIGATLKISNGPQRGTIVTCSFDPSVPLITAQKRSAAPEE